MQKWTWKLAVMLALSLVACKEEEANKKDEEGEVKEAKLCKPDEEACEVGNGKCVTGYDGDCEGGQVCYAGEGAPEGKQGTCTDGQWDAEGKVVAAVVFKGFKGGERWPRADQGPAGKCFRGCQVLSIVLPPFWLGKGPATLEASIQGPRAEAERLQVSVRGIEKEGCVKTGSALGRQQWECSFLEGWAGTHTRESLALKLWAGSNPPWTGSFLVDTQPLELALKAEVQSSQGGSHSLYVELKKSVPGKDKKEEWPQSGSAAWLKEVDYSKLEVSRNGGLIPVDWTPGKHPLPQSDASSEHSFPLPAEFLPTDTLEVRATVSAKDRAGNEVVGKELSIRLLPTN